MDNNNIPVIQRVDSPLLQPVQTELMKKFNENPSAFQPNFQIPQSVIQTTKMPDFEIRNPNEKAEQLLEESNDKHDKQIELLDEQIKILKEQLQHEKDSKAEIQLQLKDSNTQSKQLNDKISSQTYYIKELKADLKEETERRIKAEDTLSPKDWKLALISLVVGFITGVGGGIILHMIIGG